MKVSNEDARERLKLITESFEEWWHNEGTGNIDEIIFDRYKMTATLRGGIFPSSREKEIKNQVEMLKMYRLLQTTGTTLQPLKKTSIC